MYGINSVSYKCKLGRIPHSNFSQLTIMHDRHFDQANTNTIIKLLSCAGEICRAFVLMLNTCTAAQQISPRRNMHLINTA